MNFLQVACPMKSTSDLNLDELEGRSFTLGRQGHILITASAASRQHAEIIVRKGKIYLRDMGSKNGIYLKKGGKLVRFKAGSVSLLQRIVICDETYMIRDLLAIASQFVNADDNTTLLSNSLKIARQIRRSST
jgi:pSer/pThr/pTyr-binding forkhead associated (FHA) protein